MEIDRARLRDMTEAGHLTAAEAAHADALLSRTGEPIDQVITQLGLLPEAFLARYFATSAECELCLDLSEVDPGAIADHDPDLNPDFILAERVIPIAIDSDAILAAVIDPVRDEGLRGLAFALGRPVRPVVTTPSQFNALYQRRFNDRAGQAADRAFDVTADFDRLKDMASTAPVVRLVNRLITAAAGARATDIHIEPGPREAAVRLRVDGVLRDLETLDTAQALAAISRIKVLAELDIAERRRPQDGRFSLPVAGRAIDLRVSVVPAQHGESMVVRLLDPEASLQELDDLGLPAQVKAVAESVLQRPHGLVLVTGPTGSGKTTTLYSFLRQLADGERKILTIEDPIEYRLSGIAQSQTNPLIGVSFASALRSFLRHDPDVVMVGEIRDTETAQTAVQAAMTGHLVLSTLHTNDAPSAIIRLLDMGVEDYLLSSTLVGVFAQRLVRRTCPNCSGRGCTACQGSGFLGRVAIAEGFEVDDAVREAIRQSASGPGLAQLLLQQGFIPMSQDGRNKVDSGLTTMAEVNRAVGRA
ncbi:GspE/PulE family protein [Maricaulis sp.]|uniref:GspE/PulE family protein n=1 Tax=Maricaulis sp. TaxID=1486257 RepID=UPI003A933ABB